MLLWIPLKRAHPVGVLFRRRCNFSCFCSLSFLILHFKRSCHSCCCCFSHSHPWCFRFQSVLFRCSFLLLLPQLPQRLNLVHSLPTLYYYSTTLSLCLASPSIFQVQALQYSFDPLLYVGSVLVSRLHWKPEPRRMMILSILLYLSPLLLQMIWLMLFLVFIMIASLSALKALLIRTHTHNCFQPAKSFFLWIFICWTSCFCLIRLWKWLHFFLIAAGVCHMDFHATCQSWCLRETDLACHCWLSEYHEDFQCSDSVPTMSCSARWTAAASLTGWYLMVFMFVVDW